MIRMILLRSTMEIETVTIIMRTMMTTTLITTLMTMMVLEIMVMMMIFEIVMTMMTVFTTGRMAATLAIFSNGS